MSAPPDKIRQLREWLAEKRAGVPVATADCFLSGLPALDEIGLPKGALTEIVTPLGEGAGGTLLLYALLHAALGRGTRTALIDGRNSFQPRGLPAAELPRLLWSRCAHAAEALKIADLLLRDGNLPLVVLHLALNPARERVPATAWHRLQMLAEKSAVTMLVFTRAAQIGPARLRIEAGGAFPLEALHVSRDELLPRLRLRVARRRLVPLPETIPDEDLRRAACA
jgi:hypothetical protein